MVTKKKKITIVYWNIFEHEFGFSTFNEITFLNYPVPLPNGCIKKRIEFFAFIWKISSEKDFYLF